MATLTMLQTTTQVRPVTGGAWNNVSLTARVAQKNTTYGITLLPGSAGTMLRALNQWLNATGEGTAPRSAEKQARGVGIEIQERGALSTAQTGNGVTTNVVDRAGTLGPAQVIITTTVGATPTCTYLLEGSLDGAAWVAQEYADSATPTVKTTATFVITTATTKTLIVSDNVAWRFLRLTYSLNTNVTNSTDALVG